MFEKVCTLLLKLLIATSVMSDIKNQIAEKENSIAALKDKLHMEKAALDLLRKKESDGANIKWRESIIWCLKVDLNKPRFYVKTPVYISACISKKHQIEINKDVKNKIATTLSTMFNRRLIGKMEKDGKSYYGILEIFEKDSEGNYTILKSKYSAWAENLMQ